MFLLRAFLIACAAYAFAASIVLSRAKLFLANAILNRRCAKDIFFLYLHPHRWHRLIFLEHLYQRLGQAYCCGHPLSHLLICRSFAQIGTAANEGLCQIASTLMMLGLQAKHSRIVRGYAGERKKFFHSWLEVRHFGRWFCVDPVWYQPDAIARRLYYKQQKPAVKFQCSCQSFSNYPGVRLLADRLQSVATSFCLPEIQKAFSRSPRTFGFSGINRLEQLLLDADGTKFVDLWLGGFLLTQEIFESTFDTENLA